MSNMNCSEFEAALTHAVEIRSADLPEAASRHADACDACAQLRRSQAVVDRVLPAWRAGVPRVDLAEAVVSLWMREREARPAETANPPVPAPVAVRVESVASAPAANRRAVMPAVSAVCLLAFGALLLTSPGSTRPNPTPSLTIDERPAPAAVAKVPAVDAVPEFDGLVRNVGSAYLGLAYDVRDTLSDTADMIPRVEFRGELPGTNAEPKRQPNRLAPSEWTNEFKPIGRKVGEAFGFLLKAIPTDGFTST